MREALETFVVCWNLLVSFISELHELGFEAGFMCRRVPPITLYLANISVTAQVAVRGGSFPKDRVTCACFEFIS